MQNRKVCGGRIRSGLIRLASLVVASLVAESAAFGAVTATGYGPHRYNSSTLHPSPAIRMEAGCPWVTQALADNSYESEHDWNFRYTDEQGEDLSLQNHLSIVTYEPFVVNAPDVQTRGGLYTGRSRVSNKDCGGAVLYVEYNPAENIDPVANVHWIQAYHQRIGTGSPYTTHLDDLNGTSDGLPWYDSAGAAGSDWFLDRPYDVCLDCPCPGPSKTACDTDVEFQVFLAVDNVETQDGRTVHNVDVYEGIWWGYEFRCTPIPEPAALVVWSLLGASAVVLRWRRRGKE